MFFNMVMQDNIEKEKQRTNFLELSYNIFGGLFWAFIYLSVFFSLLISIYFLATHEMIYIANIGLFIFKGLFIFSLCYLFVTLIKLLKIANDKQKIRFEQRRTKLKEELKLEILKEIYGRRNTSIKKSN